MGLNRYYYQPISYGLHEVIGPEMLHMTRVMRQKSGDKIELFDGRGTLAQAHILKVGHKGVEIEIQDIDHFSRPQTPTIHLLVSMAKNDRFDWLLSKSSELGVDRITPILYERTVKQSTNPKSHLRHQELAIAAAKQCKRLFLPTIDPATEFKNTLLHGNPKQGTQLLYGHCGPHTRPISELVPPTQNMVIAIGPEGGFTDSELIVLKASGGIPVRLTKTILRIETAAIAFTAIFAVFRDAQSDNTKQPGEPFLPVPEAGNAGMSPEPTELPER